MNSNSSRGTVTMKFAYMQGILCLSRYLILRNICILGLETVPPTILKIFLFDAK